MSQKEKRIRCPNFSAMDEDVLLSIVEKYKNIIESKKTDCVSWQEKREAWDKIETEFSTQTQTYRTSKMLKDKFDNMKKRTKVTLAEEKKQFYLTGGGPCSSSQANKENKTSRIAAIMGDAATGLNNCFDGDSIEGESIIDIEILEDYKKVNSEDEEIKNEIEDSETPPKNESTNLNKWNPFILKTRKSNKLNCGKKKLDDASETSIAEAQTIFFKNEDIRAAQKQSWDGKLVEAKLALIKAKLELTNLMIEKQKAIGIQSNMMFE